MIDNSDCVPLHHEPYGEVYWQDGQPVIFLNHDATNDALTLDEAHAMIGHLAHLVERATQAAKLFT